MPAPSAPRLVLDQQFEDMDECGRSLGWSFDFRQLDAGRLDARATLVATAAGSAAMRLELNRSFHQAGSPPERMLTFGIPDTGDLGWCGAEATSSHLVNFNLPGGFDGTNRAGFSGHTVSFRKDLVEDVQRVMGLDPDRPDGLCERATWTLSRDAVARLSWGLKAGFDAAIGVSEVPSEQVSEFFDFEAPTLILRAIAEGGAPQELPGPALRRRAVAAALDYLEANDHQPLTTAELCRQVGVSAPSLYRGFMERFGIGPKRYLYVRRLEGARRDLRSAPPEVRVADIANEWGFWHMGRFAADYRRQFGERPSETQRG